MKKTLIALFLCVVMVGTVAATTVVSAGTAGKSDVRQYDMKLIDPATGQQYVFGKLTVKVLDDGTGTYVANANVQRVAKLYEKLLHINIHDVIKNHAGETLQMIAFNSAAVPNPKIFGSVTINKGGEMHGQGALDKDTVDWLAMWGSDPGTTLSPYIS
jgi:hypothetical protein